MRTDRRFARASVLAVVAAAAGGTGLVAPWDGGSHAALSSATAPVLRHGAYLAQRGRADPHAPVVAVQARHRWVALSFDDGPDQRWTPPILRSLQRAGAHATFFAIGARVRADPGLARRVVRLGNEVGNHTWSHPILLGMTRAAIRKELTRGRRALRLAGLPQPRFFRPPHGAFDRSVTASAAVLDERTIGWDVPLDRELRGHSVAQAAERAADRVRPGSIILAHDGGGRVRARTVRAIPLLLAALRRRGFRVVTVGELLADRAGRPRPAT